MKKLVLAGIAAIALAGGAALAGEMSDARVADMKGIGGSMKALGDAAKAGGPITPELVETAKKASMLADGMLAKFPAGTAEYRAKPEIWTDWAGFEKSMQDMQAAAKDLVAAAETGEAAKVGAALGAMGKTCGACHDTYRGPKPG
ncbi:MAG: cytochrome c [Pseudomonadota bacterium]|nr:cytochrome c [Pseudomonadota bacterium]